METLAAASDELVTILNFHIDGTLQSSDAEQQAVNADAVCTHYQAVGICELLLDAEVDAFFHHLIRSAQTRRWLLERNQRQPGYPERIVKASNARGLHAALAARAWPLARDIAALTATEWLPEVEYEDDFCAAHFLHRYLLGVDRTELLAVVARFEGALEGGTSPSLDLCQGLLSRDKGACEAAFEALIEQRKDKIRTMKRASVYAADALFRPLSAIFVEGLSWLSLLEAAGVQMKEEYVYCPSLARRSTYSPFEVTTFPAVPL